MPKKYVAYGNGFSGDYDTFEEANAVVEKNGNGAVYFSWEAAQQKHEADGGCPLPASIQEALNSGDGTYRP